MKIVIPLAGKGTRLRPHTLIRPKPLVQVAGKTVLQHLLDYLKDIPVSEVIFITGPQKEKVEELVKKNYKFKSRFIEQVVADGSAGAVKLAKEFIDEDVLIVFIDSLFEADMDYFKKIRNDKSVGGLIWVKEVEDYQRFGVMVTDKDGFITKIVEKPKEPISKLANIGVYYIKDYKLMMEGIDYIYKNKINLKNEYYLVDAFQYMIDHGAKIKVAPVNGWYDCGAFTTLLETNQVLLKKFHEIKSKAKNSVIIPPVFIDKDVIIEESIIGPNVSVATGCIIKGSIVKNSIIDRDAHLSDVKLKDSTIGQNALLIGNSKKLNLGDYSEVQHDQ